MWRMRAPVVSLIALASLIGAFLIPVQGALADTAPPDNSLPTTVAADSLPTAQINGVVWSQVIVGDTVFVGGEFTRARPAGAASGTSEVSRNNLMAYNVTTGVMTSFNPSLNGTVRAITASPDGSRIYVGGAFTKVGTQTRTRLAAFDTATGELVSTWKPTANSTVRALGAFADTVYAGGSFTSASGESRQKIASFVGSTGVVGAWKGNVPDGAVNALTVSPSGDRVVIGGSFTSYNGSTTPGYGMAATDSSTGAGLIWNIGKLIKNAGPNGAILSLSSDEDGVYGTGYDYGSGAMFEGTFHASWRNGNTVWIEDCHGDTYSAVPVGDVVYTTAHAHFCGNIGGFGETSPRSYHRTLTFTKAATGTITRNVTGGSYFNFEGRPSPTLLAFYPDINTGTYTGQGQGPWNLTANSQYVLYGGEFTIVNNKRQQGLARFAVTSIAPNTEGPRVSGTNFLPNLATPTANTVAVTWTSNYDRDNEQLTYEVLRDGVVVETQTGLSTDWNRPDITWTDTGVTGGTAYSYKIRAIDPFGNTVTGAAATVTATGSGEPDPVVTYAQDAFGRSVGSGLGTADTGGKWANLSPSSNYSVADGVARFTIEPGRIAGAGLLAVSQTDVDLSVTATLTSQGTPATIIVVGRKVGSNEYRASLQYSVAGDVTLRIAGAANRTLASTSATGVTDAVGAPLRVRMQVVGVSPTVIAAKVWKAGSAEPTAWQVSVSDSASALQSRGYVALALLPGVSTTPATATFDELVVTEAAE
ncbi:hypothetical protein [Cryobacterium sp. PH29-G1]|uniref:hypothetical protein n=1 Tax=Cryobacterium sp. PH29-G1 TaxID=3046211 RepID=UPI0024B9FD4C|nr:hypothetical protein [Cryobacterium sp. PH29-G1]MDJ0349986.1 hypothetical protein [Cryobacterium sp. PH29-G1]